MPLSKEITAQQKLCLENYRSHITHKYAPNTVENHLYLLRMFAKGVQKEFDKVTRQDIDNYLSTLKPLTAEIMKSKLRKFYVWFYHTDKKHLPEVVADLECNVSAYKPKKTDKNVLTKEQIEKLCVISPELQNKALLEAFLITGGRNTEIRSLNLEDIREEDGAVIVHLPWVKNQGGASYRTIPVHPIADNPVAFYPKHLMQWLQLRLSEPKSNPLFVSLSPASYGKRITSSGVEGIVHRMGVGVWEEMYDVCRKFLDIASYRPLLFISILLGRI